jgi:citrate lyase subunit beta/citryl-CoA lyase
VAPGAKEEARGNIVQALKEGDWTGKTVVVRVNGVSTKWCYRDVIEVVENAWQFLDCLMIPKVEYASDVQFVSTLLDQIEETLGIDKRIGLEVQVETATGITNIDAIASVADIEELNIGHSIISRAALVGLDAAVREMAALMRSPRRLPTVPR